MYFTDRRWREESICVVDVVIAADAVDVVDVVTAVDAAVNYR